MISESDESVRYFYSQKMFLNKTVELFIEPQNILDDKSSYNLICIIAFHR